MANLYNKIRIYFKTYLLLIESWIYKIIHNIKGQKLSPFGEGLRDYTFEILTNPDNPKITCTGYQRMMYEETITDCMNENNISRDAALAQIFVLLSGFDVEKTKEN